ncbi:DUF2977 domain-containing protein [Mammaliicoccus sciuri]|uniref:DUF2977 domain-containing protein n=1 Tax=Mammaliicoccus sciuri TaxID=1296 RepID=UPI0021D231C6|nr:DUF2977 domain-containing protein [Mammaliicoccus sciuri]UXV14863.1 DUF2977 domain-containing protein [Mammaliicoccus sciuri]UXV25905.1 DUF2977 domain-containing protein [Mammaliicoccus sciuri]
MEMNTDGVVNDKLNIKVNSNDEITQYAIIGGLGEGGIYVPYNIAPDNFITDFKNGYFLYKDGVISINPDYKPSHEIE